MANPKDILVLTVSSVDGLKIKQYLKPVSAHVVAGTNLFNDFLGGLTDVFGGRSQTYQKQLTSLYNEAVELVKIAAFEIGANCIVGLSIDMDEISGKGKSMFMLTAIGTAVVLEKDVVEKSSLAKSTEKVENVGVDKIDNLRVKKTIIENSKSGNLSLDDDTWRFITINQVSEVWPHLLNKFSEVLQYEETSPEKTHRFFQLLVSYIEALPEIEGIALLYMAMKEEHNEQLAWRISNIIKELKLFYCGKCMELLQNEDFKVRKRGLRIATYDMNFYNEEDINDLQTIRNCVVKTFGERGIRTTKKQLLSSKEKEMWTCECSKVNDMGAYCSGCYNDIYGFKQYEVKPIYVDNYVQQKIELISEYLG